MGNSVFEGHTAFIRSEQILLLRYGATSSVRELPGTENREHRDSSMDLAMAPC
jgi:hypothetical protein